MVDALSALRETITRIERRAPTDMLAPAPFGVAAVDRALVGGLARGRLHELFAAEPGDTGSAAGFAAMLACLAAPGDTPLVWLRQEEAERRGGRLHAPGLAEIGLDPARLLLVVLPDPVALLRAAADVVRCPQVGVAVIELWKSPRALDLTASSAAGGGGRGLGRDDLTAARRGRARPQRRADALEHRCRDLHRAGRGRPRPARARPCLAAPARPPGGRPLATGVGP